MNVEHQTSTMFAARQPPVYRWHKHRLYGTTSTICSVFYLPSIKNWMNTLHMELLMWNNIRKAQQLKQHTINTAFTRNGTEVEKNHTLHIVTQNNNHRASASERERASVRLYQYPCSVHAPQSVFVYLFRCFNCVLRLFCFFFLYPPHSLHIFITL